LVNSTRVLVALSVWFTASQALADDAALEDRVNELEARLEKLERLVDEKFADDRWQEPVLWSRIRPGMSESDVRTLLGKPARVEEAIFTTWYYHETSRDHSHVWFDEGKVLGWEGLDR
jgi:outer membrane protein assembly factor BamE (lipoprotein component of BamABCDE complex)